MRHALIAAALLAAPAAALADGIQYNFVDARYFSTDSDALNVNLQGAQLAVSHSLGEFLFLAADAQYGRSESVATTAGNGRVETLSGAFRIGAHHAITPALDVVASAGALYSEVQGKGALSNADDDDIGYTAAAGLRLALMPKVEVGAFYTYQDVLEGEQSFFSAELQYHVTSQFSAVGAANNGRDRDAYSIGVRYHF